MVTSVNRVFCVLVALACFTGMALMVQAQGVTVDDGTQSWVYDANGGVVGPSPTAIPGVQISGGANNVEIVGSTTTFGVALGAPVVTIDNTTGNITGVGTLTATTINGTTINGTTINTTGAITGVGLDAGTGAISGTGGLNVTSPDGLSGVVVSNTGTAITGALGVTGATTLTGGLSATSLNGLRSVVVNNTGTTVTGGLNNTGGGITNAGTISGVTNGVAAGDAVNLGQVNGMIDGMDQSLSSGIASIAALASIPGPVCGKNTSIGLGYGHYNGESAFAVGVKANLPKSDVSVAGGVGFSSNSSPAANLGVSLSF